MFMNCVWCVVDALCETGGHISMHYLITGTLFVRRLLTTADGGRDTVDTRPRTGKLKSSD